MQQSKQEIEFEVQDTMKIRLSKKTQHRESREIDGMSVLGYIFHKWKITLYPMKNHLLKINLLQLRKRIYTNVGVGFY